MMNRRLVFMMLALLPVIFSSGCAITGRSAGILENQAMRCSLSTSMDFLSVGDRVQACYTDNGIYFAVENTGSSGIAALSVRLDADYNLTMLIREGIAAGQTSQQSLNFGGQRLSQARSITIYPLVDGAGGDELCVEAAITAQLEKC